MITLQEMAVFNSLYVLCISSSKEMGFLNPNFPLPGESGGAV